MVYWSKESSNVDGQIAKPQLNIQNYLAFNFWFMFLILEL